MVDFSSSSSSQAPTKNEPKQEREKEGNIIHRCKKKILGKICCRHQRYNKRRKKGFYTSSYIRII